MRGQKQAADNNLALTNKTAAAEGASGTQLMQPSIDRSNQVYGVAEPSLEAMVKRPGYSDATKATMRNDTLGGVASAYDATARNAANRATRTNNAGSYNDLAAELARSKARDTGAAAGDLNVQFENEANRQKEAGIKGLTDLYGVNSDTLTKLYNTRGDVMSKLYGLGPQTLDARAAGGGWSQGFKDVGSTVSGFGRRS